MTVSAAAPVPRLHHVGVVVADVAEATAAYERDFGYVREGGVVDDPMQKVRIQFLLARGGGRVELLQPAGPDSPVQLALKKGGGPNHFCYEVGSIDDEVARYRKQGAVLVSAPVRAPAIGGARVAFLLLKAHGVFELVESPALVPPAPP